MSDSNEQTGLLTGSSGQAAYRSTSPESSTKPSGPKRLLSLADVQEAVTLSWTHLNAHVIAANRGWCGRASANSESKQIITDCRLNHCHDV